MGTISNTDENTNTVDIDLTQDDVNNLVKLVRVKLRESLNKEDSASMTVFEEEISKVEEITLDVLKTAIAETFVNGVLVDSLIEGIQSLEKETQYSPETTPPPPPPPPPIRYLKEGEAEAKPKTKT